MRFSPIIVLIVSISASGLIAHSQRPDDPRESKGIDRHVIADGITRRNQGRVEIYVPSDASVVGDITLSLNGKRVPSPKISESFRPDSIDKASVIPWRNDLVLLVPMITGWGTSYSSQSIATWKIDDLGGVSWIGLLPSSEYCQLPSGDEIDIAVTYEFAVSLVVDGATPMRTTQVTIRGESSRNGILSVHQPRSLDPSMPIQSLISLGADLYHELKGRK